MKDADIGRGVRGLVVDQLACDELLDRRERVADLETRVEGYRVVNGGQVDRAGSWEITDAESGELLANGVGIDSYEAAWQESWFHVDAIASDVHETTPAPDDDYGLPQSLADAIAGWVRDEPGDARQILEESSKRAKAADELDNMVMHVRYEILKLINFLGVGNKWIDRIEGLPDGWGNFAGDSMLEAALIHTRCVAEFLRRSDGPSDTITARDYVPDWHWTKGEGLKADLAEIHGRVAHLGLIRLSVQREDFNWHEFLLGTAVPTLLAGFREFLGRLDPEHVERFAQPRPHDERIDLTAVITNMIGPATA